MSIILVVDDHIVNREFLSVLLGYAGHQVICAGDGAEGLTVIDALRPDLVISDVLMPGMGGVEFARKLKNDSRTANVPIIFYTATYRLTEAYKLAEDCGVATVLGKPSDPKTILATVGRVLGIDANTPHLQGPPVNPAPGYLKELADLQHRMSDAISRGLAQYGEGITHETSALDPGFETVQTLSMRLFALLELALALMTEHERPTLLDVFCRATQNIIGCRYVVVAFLDRESRAVEEWGSSGLSMEAVASLPSIDWQASFMHDVLMIGSRYRDQQIGDTALQIGLPGVHPPVNAVLAVPVRSATSAPGLLYLADKLKGKPFCEEDEMFAVMLAAQLAVVHGGLMSHEDLQRHAAQLEIELYEKEKQKNQIARLNHLYAMLSGINSIIVRSKNRDFLFSEACRLAVVDGGFKCAWIMRLDPTTQECSIAAHWGDMPKSNSIVRFSGRPCAPEDDTPINQAMRTMRPVVCNDCLSEPLLAPLRDAFQTLGYRSSAVFPLLVDDQVFGAFTVVSADVNYFDDKEVKLLDEMVGDISFCIEHISKIEELRYMVFYDTLTGLPNNNLYFDRLSQMLISAEQNKKTVKCIVIDLVGFTMLNSEAGRHVGDLVLKQIASRLTGMVGNSGCVARCGADMFAVAAFAQGITGSLTENLLAAIERPLDLTGRTFRITAQAGVALFPSDGITAETLFKRAESALGHGRALGQRSQYYAPEINERIAVRRSLENDLRAALEAREFILHFQPRINLSNGHIEAAEALVRWQHPERGLIPPGQFIPLAEETGLIVPLGAWVIDATCRQQAAWQNAGLEIVPVSINLSALQIQKGQVVQNLVDAIRQNRLDARFIECELTESVLMHDSEKAISVLNKIRSIGVSLSLDDFGTGYSSLSYLKKYPFDVVKIDRSFVIDITRNPDDAALAATIIAMARRMNLKVVAEGVETRAQLGYLQQLGCDEMQGFLFSSPLPSSDFADLIRREAKLALIDLNENRDQNTLLLVDDDPMILNALKRTLRRENCRVLTATSSEAALNILAVENVKVVISDQRLPDIPGDRLLGIIRELYPDTVRIVLSGHADPDAIVQSINKGSVFRYLIKPCDDDSLRRHVREAFSYYRPPTHRTHRPSVDRATQRGGDMDRQAPSTC